MFLSRRLLECYRTLGYGFPHVLLCEIFVSFVFEKSLEHPSIPVSGLENKPSLSVTAPECGRKMSKPAVSVIIPAFNEEKNIDDVLTRLYKAAESNSLPYEIIVVDDGSTDKTKVLACRPEVIVLGNETNQGKGFALQRGFQHAQGDIIVTMDSDGSHDPEDIERLIVPLLNGADVVLGSRFLAGQGNDSTKKLHVFGNILINFLVLVMTGKYITDSQTGFRAYRKKVLQEIDITSEGYHVETELTVKTLRNDNVVEEVPIKINKRMNGCSHLNPLTDGFRIFKTIVKSSIIH